SGDQNVSTLGQSNVAQNQRVSFVIGKRERAQQEFKFRRREPGQSLQSAYSVEVGFARRFFRIQSRTAPNRACTRLAPATDKREIRSRKHVLSQKMLGSR